MTEQGKTGYNYIEVANLFAKVLDVATETKSILSRYLNEEVIDPMSKLWYAPEAKEFFKSFQRTVAEEEKNIDKAFQFFVDKIDLAQHDWSEETEGGEVAEKVTVETEKIFLNVAKIKDQNDGNIYIAERSALNFAEGLTSLREKIVSDIKTQETLLKEASLAFIGDDQGAAIQKCFEGILKTISDIFDFLTTGENSLKETIISVTEEYRRFARRISEEMSSK